MLFSVKGNILLKLIAPNLPLSIFKKSNLDLIFKCFGLGLDRGAKYIIIPILNNTPINGLSSFPLKL